MMPGVADARAGSASISAHVDATTAGDAKRPRNGEPQQPQSPPAVLETLRAMEDPALWTGFEVILAAQAWTQGQLSAAVYSSRSWRRIGVSYHAAA